MLIKSRKLNGYGASPIFIFGALLLAVLGTSVSSASAEVCPNEAFRTGFSSSLPDCRAYEQVSPTIKNGNSAQGYPGLLLVSEDGERATYYSGSATPIPASGEGAQDFPTNLASRDLGIGSWSSQRLLPPQQIGRSAAFLGATPNLRYAVVEAEHKGYESPGYGRGLFIIETASGTVETIVVPEENQFEVPYAFDGASEDGSQVFFETKAALAPGATAYADNLYMWDRGTGQVTYVALVPEESSARSCTGALGEGTCIAPEGAFGGAYEWYEGSTLSEGGALKGMAVGALHAISPSGGQIYFTSAENGRLYLRRGLDGPDPSTVLVSAPAVGQSDPVLAPLAAFQEATPDGRFAFFVSNGELTEDSNTGEGAAYDLYRWDAQTEEVTDLTPDATGGGAKVQALLGASSDGSSGYFAARGVLPVVNQPGPEGPRAGAANLYRFSASGAAESFEFIATLGGNDGRNWSPRAYRGEADIANEKVGRTSRVDSSADTLLFTSKESLTGYDNIGPLCTSPGGEGPCDEIFRFAAPTGPAGTTGHLDCISCDPNGAPPVGSAALQDEVFDTNGTLVPGSVFEGPNAAPAVLFPGNLSADGDTAFFQSANMLVPGDINGVGGCPPSTSQYNLRFTCQDVYEWESVGSGSCTSAEVNGGCLYLISTGTSSSASYFAGASEEGESAFIITASQAVPADRDTYPDLYAARVGGGLANQYLGPPIACIGEACLPPPSGSPTSSTPASSELRPSDNVKKHRKPKRRHKNHQHKHKKPKRRHKSSSAKHHKPSKPSHETNSGANK